MSVALQATATRSRESVGVFVWASALYTVAMAEQVAASLSITKVER